MSHAQILTPEFTSVNEGVKICAKRSSCGLQDPGNKKRAAE